MKKIYLDYASTTPVDPEVKRVMEPYFSEKFGNAGAIHGFGQEVQAAMDEARQKVADFLGCDFEEIIFTGSATESNNLAIRGVLRGSDPLYVGSGTSHIKPHIITSAIEHKSVLETCHDLEKDGAEITYLPVTKDGFVRPEDVEKAIRENTVLVSIMYVNNEIGTIQQISEIAKVISNYKVQTIPLRGISHRETNYKLIFHTDAVQALNYLDCNVENLGVDLLSFSGHKIYGPKGIGGLYIRKGTPISPVITGGSQETGMRAGTENIPSIVGLGRAVEVAAANREKENPRLEKLRDYFIDEVLKKIKNAELNGSKENRVANNANILFHGAPANKFLIALDQVGIAASAGSACSAKIVSPSWVVTAIGRNQEEAKQSIRFTLGRETTKEDIDYAVSALIKSVGLLTLVENSDTID